MRSTSGVMRWTSATTAGIDTASPGQATTLVDRALTNRRCNHPHPRPSRVKRLEGSKGLKAQKA